MKAVVLYYSFGGRTKAEAEEIAKEKGAVLCRIEEEKPRNILTAFIPGCLHAMKRRPSAIKSFNCDLAEFDEIIIGAPIWGGCPAPAFNSIVKKLPSQKDVTLFFCSGSGDTLKSKQGTIDMITDQKCNVIAYRDICTAKKK
ncbi:MAG: hypothetical protein EOM59_05570 [Clostridia bacterium]|nr:hypothetical protein [Clostridia bacterium]